MDANRLSRGLSRRDAFRHLRQLLLGQRSGRYDRISPDGDLHSSFPAAIAGYTREIATSRVSYRVGVPRRHFARAPRKIPPSWRRRYSGIFPNIDMENVLFDKLAGFGFPWLTG